MKKRTSYKNYKTRLYLVMSVLMSALFMQNPVSAQTDEINYRGWVRAEQSDSKERRIALVIGNSEYQYSAKLKEPANDASTIAEALKHQGFEVEIGYNLDRKAFNEAIESFSEKFRRYDAAVVYYAGHGFQIDGENYLIPIDANPETSFQVHSQCINVEYFFKAFNEPEKDKVIILDACRNNPFVKNRSWTSEYRGNTNGMTEISPMTNSLMIFSTEKNSVVRDDNPFSEILAENIRNGGCISRMLGKVAAEVRKINPSQRVIPVGVLENGICFGSDHTSSLNQSNAADSDGDLIPDKIDKCPNEHGTIENGGCPTSQSDGLDEDSDGDGLSNRLDNCPEKPGPIENRGCPDAIYSGPFDSGTFTDDRDGKPYKWVRLKDGKKWMSENLRFESESSWCYDNKKKNCESQGRLYTWNSAQTACPKGWRLPNDYEWQKIIEFYGGEQDAYRSLVINKEHNFDPRFAGGRKVEKDFCCSGDFGNFWSTDHSQAKASYADFNKPLGYIELNKHSKEWAISCRCISEK